MPPGPDAKPYEFSWRWGLENDPGHQGYHGLKEEVHDEFLAVGKAKLNAGHMPNPVGYEAEGGDAYFSTTVLAPRDMTAYALTGPLKPAQVRLNSEVVAGTELKLKAGANPLVLRYPKPGRTYFVVSTEPGTASPETEAFTPAASWIWYPNERITADRWFRKTFDLGQVPTSARLRITCDNGYNVAINGTSIGQGNRWETVQEYEVSPALRPGRNEIVVRASNQGDMAGLIAQLTAGTLRIVTDRTWRAAKTETGETVDAEPIAPFADSLWYRHQHGPPKLETFTKNEPSQFKVSPLAMSWWRNPAVLPFDVRANEATPVGWYRFVSPPGLRSLTVAARGTVAGWAEGEVMAGAAGKFTVSRPSARPVTVLLRIEQERGCYGGAALPEPIRLECGPGSMAPGDWSKNEGLWSYSGGAWYRKTVNLPEAKQVILDLGAVVASAEIRVNGRLTGISVAPPWSQDITPFVKPGDNRLEVLVCNTLANHYTTVPTRYRGSTVSGLLGPVFLRIIR
jgi:hypothetical protein